MNVSWPLPRAGKADEDILRVDELGNWRADRNMFGFEYFDAYHEHIEMSEPKEDYDDRNALYALRFNLYAASLFPHKAEYLQM